MVEITGKTRLLGVIGHPVRHSFSPLMHNAALAEMGVDCSYVALPVKPDELEVAIAGFAAIELVGFNITIPHKQSILPLLTSVSEVAQAVGAVNTVWWMSEETGEPPGWRGTNTDVEGFLAPLQRMERDWNGAIAVVLGNGGAARAVVAGCAMLGCSEIHVVGRNAAKLEAFAASWSGSQYGKNLQVRTWEGLSDLMPKADLLVNTTPVGMAPKVEASPVDAEVMAKLKAGAIVYDLIYVPNPTRFLALAQERGAVAIDGLEMLVQQGAAALRIWTGREDVPVEIMGCVLRSHLGLS